MNFDRESVREYSLPAVVKKCSEEAVANTENLSPWAEGQSGNPSGKPKGTLNRATILRHYLSAPMKEAPTDIPVELEGRITVEEAIALALIKKALSGDIAAIKEVQDTVHGKIVETSEVSHAYTQMGSVIMHQANGTICGLTFDVGGEANTPFC